MKDALLAGATLGEVSDALRDVFGTYQRDGVVNATIAVVCATNVKAD